MRFAKVRASMLRLLPVLLLGSSACVVDHDAAIAFRREPLFVDGTFGSHRYKLFVPSSYAADRPMPLVMMLHGCTQDPSQFASSTQYNTLAESQGFLVVYPEQPSSEDSTRCWSWFKPMHQSRGAGQPEWLASLVSELGKKYSIDRSRVYVGGLSAGAAMSVILGATYPDVFAAIAVGSGLEYRAASGSSDALTAMRSGGPSPATQGRTAYRAMGAAARVVPVIVFHGSSDGTVAPVNADQIISQWVKTNDLAADGSEDGTFSDTPDSTISGSVPSGRSYSRASYRDKRTGREALAKVLVQGMGHAWSGGSTSGSFSDPKGPDATAMSWEFFRSHPMGSVMPSTDGGVDAGGHPDMTAPLDLGNDLARPDLTTPDLAMPDFSMPQDMIRHQDMVLPPDLLPPATKILLLSIAAESGFVGQVAADGIGVGTIKAGDKGLFNADTFRTILSFDTTGLPTTAPRAAELVLVRKGMTGAATSLSVDVKRGAFGRDASLASDDHAAAASATGVASFAPPARDNDQVVVPIPLSALGSLAAPRVQLRITAKTAADFRSDVIEFWLTGVSAAQLVLTY